MQAGVGEGWRSSPAEHPTPSEQGESWCSLGAECSVGEGDGGEMVGGLEVWIREALERNKLLFYGIVPKWPDLPPPTFGTFESLFPKFF